MASPLLPIIVFLFVSTCSLSFSHATPNFLTIPFSLLTPFSISCSSNSFTHHLYHIIHPPCHQERVRVLLAIKEEVIVDDPLVEAKRGEEAPHSKSECSVEEEGSRNPSNECPHLINPWYDTYFHFRVVSSDYLPPYMVCVWVSLKWLNSEVSWAPLASSIPDPAIRQGDLWPSSSNLGRVHHLVGKSGLTRSSLIQVSWRRFSGPTC